MIYKEVTSQHNLRKNRCSQNGGGGGSFEVFGSFIKLSVDACAHTQIYMKHLQQYRACHGISQNLIISVELFRTPQQYLGGPDPFISAGNGESPAPCSQQTPAVSPLNLQGRGGGCPKLPESGRVARLGLSLLHPLYFHYYCQLFPHFFPILNVRF